MKALCEECTEIEVIKVHYITEIKILHNTTKGYTTHIHHI